MSRNELSCNLRTGSFASIISNSCKEILHNFPCYFE
ncbi:hypothetical protein T11_6097 [Trichinella zimbabwensis]|uniref:Uncharacterized protein n=1 Tax=Trichinella zimbabwensis TaxID=268475 RepID=A0A0V1GQV6_9BILA|nr:hypothetical protein T11_9592 [Trichinella zimbabwensis]KRZ00482.1 hypothetical protein T11_6097 [Trichinella zimbabwensis]